MKVLFLDVDGVLNSYKTGGMYSLKKPCLRRLQTIINETDAKIVLSSTWRKYPEALKKLKNVLKYRNLSIYDVTPDLGKHRGLEIARWLSEYVVDKYAIVDDDSDMEVWQLPNFFQTDGDYGLTDTITYRIIQHFKERDIK